MSNNKSRNNNVVVAASKSLSSSSFALLLALGVSLLLMGTTTTTTGGGIGMVMMVNAQEEEQDGGYADVPRSSLSLSARVKEHRKGAEGKLVHGEEELRKVILSWTPVKGAVSYQICHQCQDYIDKDTGKLKDGVDESDLADKLHKVGLGPEHTCGGEPCLVLPNSPLGWNHYHLRVRLERLWSVWSKQHNFKVSTELGYVDHEEL